MYLPTFQKLTFELVKRRSTTLAQAGAVALFTFIPTLFYNQMYNLYYTDIVPPPSGVIKREEED